MAAVLRRAPRVALVDDLAHAGSGPPRWQGVEVLLDAGIDVVTTVRVEQLESLYDVVEGVTGVAPGESVPDAVVRRADQVELVDMSPEALRRRVAHGNVHAPEDVDAALGSRFRVGTLAALREMSLLWLADRVEEGLQAYRHDHGIDRAWEVRERVVVALTGGAEGDTLVRRAARIATRQRGDLLAVHVAMREGLPAVPPGQLATQRALVERLGGSFHVVVGDDVPAALLAFARAESATQLVLGTSRRGRLAQLRAPGTGVRAVRGSGPIDVHLVPHEASGAGPVRLPARAGGVTPRRRLLGAVTGLVALPLLTVVLVAARDRLALGSQLLLYLACVVLVALVGGTWPALVAAVAAALLGNWYFTRPFQTLRVADSDDLVSLVVFVVVAVAVSAVVDLAARRTREAARSRAESEAMAALSGDVLRGERTLPALLNRARELLGLQEVRLLETVDGAEQVIGVSGTAAVVRPRSRPCRSPTACAWSCAAGRSPRTSCACSAPSRRRPRSRSSAAGCGPRPATPSCSARSTGCAPRCSRRSATTCTPRWRRRRRRSARCAPPTWRGRRGRPPSCSPPPRSRSTSSPPWSATCST